MIRSIVLAIVSAGVAVSCVAQEPASCKVTTDSNGRMVVTQVPNGQGIPCVKIQLNVPPPTRPVPDPATLQKQRAEEDAALAETQRQNAQRYEDQQRAFQQQLKQTATPALDSEPLFKPRPVEVPDTTIRTNTTSETSADIAARQQENVQKGEAIGNGFGALAVALMQRHAFNKAVNRYCSEHAGLDWNLQGASGHCMSDIERIGDARATVFRHHKKMALSSQNMSLLTEYVTSHAWNPFEPKSFDRAYKELNSAGLLALK